jgi:hypothetical protein
MQDTRSRLRRGMAMPQTMATLCVLAFAVTISARELCAQEPPPAARPSAANPVPPAEVGPTRLFFAPTARSLRRGKGSLGLTEIIFPSAEVGLTDHVSLRGFGVLPLEDLSDGGVVLAPKVQLLSRTRVQGAVGAVHLFGPGETGGIVYGVVTLGSADAGVTVGYGYGYGQLADSEGSPAVLFFGGDKAIGRNWRLIIEGYVGGAALGLPDQTLVGGTRFSRGRWSVDLGVVVPIYETGAGQPFPVLTIAWAF